MDTVEKIRSKVKELFEKSPRVTVSVKSSHPKVSISSAPAEIKAIYPNFFHLEECGCAYPRRHTVAYSDLLTGKVVIAELSKP